MARTIKQVAPNSSRKQCTGQRPGVRGQAQRALNKRARHATRMAILVGSDVMPVVRKGVDRWVS